MLPGFNQFQARRKEASVHCLSSFCVRSRSASVLRPRPSFSIGILRPRPSLRSFSIGIRPVFRRLLLSFLTIHNHHKIFRRLSPRYSGDCEYLRSSAISIRPPHTLMKIAIEGCMHGDLDNVYATLLHLQEVEKTKIDLLICCGDFQAVRNEKDLESLSVPPKYRAMNSFWKYYSGEKVAPFPTIFIGGNHEASNYLWELYYGGWAAPHIYFLGFAGIVKFGNIRIGGLSGIYKSRDYHLGHFERPPYNNNDIKSVYHVREYDVHKLMQVEEPVDIFISHDWPLGVTDHGNWKGLVHDKPHFEKEIQDRTLGSKAAAELLEKLKPPYWFSAHLHCKFAALVQHGDAGPVTKFLALDKCIPRRKFLQIIEVESEPGPYEIQYDEEWLAITRKLHSVFPLTAKRANFGGVQVDMEESRRWVGTKLQSRGNNKPFEFVRTVPCYNPSQTISNVSSSGHVRNPQTESLLKFLELPYVLDESESTQSPASLISRVDYDSEDGPNDDVDEIELPEEEDDE